jgi:hypothetical protein
LRDGTSVDDFYDDLLTHVYVLRVARNNDQTWRTRLVDLRSSAGS